MRYYFNFRDGSHRILDEDGLELPNLDGARADIGKALDELLVENPDLARDGSGWTMEVSDSSGAVLLTFVLDGSRR